MSRIVTTGPDGVPPAPQAGPVRPRSA